MRPNRVALLSDLDHHVVLAFAAPAPLTFAWGLRRSSQYFFILRDTARLAAADICRVRVVAVFTARRALRRRLGSASSGNVRSIATISARSCFKSVCAPVTAS